MRRHFHFRFRFLFIAMLFAAGGSGVFAQADSNAPLSRPVVPSGTGAVAQVSGGTAAAPAGAAVQHRGVVEFCRETAHELKNFFNIHKGDDNSWQRFLLAAGVLVLFWLARRLVLAPVFRLAASAFKRARLGLVERLILRLEKPAALFFMIIGVYTAVRMLHYSTDVAVYLSKGARILFAVTFLWAVVRVAGTLIDFAHDRARVRQSPIATFMPWIRKAVIVVIVVLGALGIMQNVLGWEIQAFLATLGIGGLAFALAAQDTIANIFGAVVVAIDQPFRHGDLVQIAGHTGTVEDVGVRSTKLRRTDKSVVVIPNKAVASETIVNLSKFTGRRVEMVLNFTYDSTPEQMAAIVADIKALINADPEVRPEATQVFFRDLNPSSLDVWVVYETKEPNFNQHMELRQRLNLAFMRAAAVRGMGFAFPTQTIDLAPSAAKALGK